ncbi:hypothetical protein BDN70DRAFT_728459 [Pholiota conissans]|uniref:Uncharacterized protein n=1 Tax=Pholiota conissans TaxID=109636 RepID=A0A9P5YZR9_9AGAR|nr:hypothetical protein BDN70DRAFT_728459 [Pholiota conissans]
MFPNRYLTEQGLALHDILMGAAPSNTLRVPELESARPSSEFSSIGPSQSASQINAHELPPPISMAAVMNSGAFADVLPTKPSETLQAEAHTQRPSSHNSSATGSSIFSNTIPATYQVETVKYAPAIAVRVPRTELEAPATEPKVDYTSIPIPAPHALEGYTYDIPTATLPPPVAGPSGLQPSHRTHDSGYSSPQRTITPQPQPLVSAFHSHVLERRITEDSQEDRQRNSAVPNQDDDIDSFDDVKEEQKLVQEGKLAIVENPRFMSEARKREIEREKERAARKEEEERRKLEKGKQRETGESEKEPGSDKKRFSLFHHHPKPDKHETRTVTFSPSTADTHDHDGDRVSPSKGFFGTIRGLFTKPLVPSPTRTSRSPARSETRAARTDDEYSISDNEPSPTKASGRGFQGLFRPSDKNKTRPSNAPWETRTDKNIRQLARQSSFDEPVAAKPGRVGLGLAGSAVATAGVVNATGAGLQKQKSTRGRTVSDIGTGASRAVPEAGYAGKRLKKSPRVGQPAATSPPVRGTDRRSASVDYRGENRWLEEEEGGDEMIVDLGRRRKVGSEVGAPPAEPTKRRAATSAKQAQAPEHAPASITAQAVDVFGPTQTTKGYSSDTAAVQPSASGTVRKKKSLTKKREPVRSPAPSSTVTAPTAPAALPPPAPIIIPSAPKATTPPQATTAAAAAPTPTPVRRGSIRSNVPSIKSPPSQQAGPATVLAAGGEHPSGVLIHQRGWNEQAQAQGGTLSRHNSTTSAASAPTSGSSATKGGKRKSPLGQGMGGSGGVARRASLSGGAPSGKMETSSRAANVNAPTASLVQPLPPALNLMSIVEDVARTNREGWTPETKTRKSMGGTQKAVGLMEVVKAPPPMERAKLEALDAAEMRHWASGSTTTLTMATSPATSRTGMFEIKAPGSVFDQRQAEVPKQPAQVQQPAAVASLSTTYGRPGRPEGLTVPKAPLRSALRTPSPAARPSRTTGQSAQQHCEEQSLPPPVEGVLPWGSDGALEQPRKVDKGKAPAHPEEDTDHSGDESNEVFYSDLEEEESASRPPAVEPASTKQVLPEQRVSMPAEPTTAMNGHAITGHAKTTSEVSQSSTSTAQPRLPHDQSPRRRKSVRVSLQPTFSPSPPAIEYDDEEEQRLHAPWAWSTVQAEQRPSVSRQPHPSLAAPLLPAPVPLRAPVRTVATSEEPDMWANSSDEDEEYTRAKRALTRAARKERDTKAMVVNAMR